MFKKLLNRFRKPSEEEEERLEEEWYDQKSLAMEGLLGKEHDMVMHAIIPYDLDGALDLYYYPNGIPGTAIATKELSHACRESSKNDKFKSYELVMFTRHTLNMDQAQDVETEFGSRHQNINAILNPIARYSEQAKLNPNETCEFPEDFEGIGGKCLMFADYNPQTKSKEEFGLMAIIEVHRSEMEFAMENGGAALIDLLKESNYYPYTDMDRQAVA